jgi:hypothetical protein
MAPRTFHYRLCNGPSPVQAATLPKLPDRLPGLRVKKSKRWAVDTPLLEDTPLPMINQVGQFVGVTLFRVPCTVSQAIATIVATVGSRLESHLVRHQGYRVAVKSRWLVIRSAYYYSMSKNNWFLDRFLAVSRSNNWEKAKKSIFSLLVKFLAKMDAYNRFVYGQVCHQTHWLLTRGPKSAPRDKSLFFKSDSLKRHWAGIGPNPFSGPDDDLKARAFGYVLMDFTGITSRDLVYRPQPGPIGPARPEHLRVDGARN